MVLCVVVGCSSKSGKEKGLKLFRIPKVITNQGEEQEKLTTGRRNERIFTMSQDAANKKLASARE